MLLEMMACKGVVRVAVFVGLITSGLTLNVALSPLKKKSSSSICIPFLEIGNMERETCVYAGHDVETFFTTSFLQRGWMGPNYSISTACATSNFCILSAANHIIRGEADLMLCGGSDAAIIPIGLGGFVACKALSRGTVILPKHRALGILIVMDLIWGKVLVFCFWKN